MNENLFMLSYKLPLYVEDVCGGSDQLDSHDLKFDPIEEITIRSNLILKLNLIRSTIFLTGNTISDTNFEIGCLLFII